MHEQRKNLYHYIIPALLGNIGMFILTIVDGMFVGNGVGTDALGAVSLAMPFVMLVGAFSVLFNIGGVVPSSQILWTEKSGNVNKSAVEIYPKFLKLL